MKRILIIQNNMEENLGLYERYLREIANVTLIKAYESPAHFEYPSINGFDAFLVGPTPISANNTNDYDFLRKEIGYLKKIIKSGKPCLGVCCGGQMLALALGARVMNSPVKEIGGYTVCLTKEGSSDPLFYNFPSSFPVFQWHSEMFSIPPNGHQILSGDPCPIQGFRKGNIWGILFHLELDNNDAQRWSEAYPYDPPSIGKSIEQVIQECKQNDDLMKELAKELMINFTKLDLSKIE